MAPVIRPRTTAGWSAPTATPQTRRRKKDSSPSAAPSPRTGPTASLIALLLVANSSRGSHIVFQWPPKPKLFRRLSQVRYYNSTSANTTTSYAFDRQHNAPTEHPQHSETEHPPHPTTYSRRYRANHDDGDDDNDDEDYDEDHSLSDSTHSLSSITHSASSSSSSSSSINNPNNPLSPSNYSPSSSSQEELALRHEQQQQQGLLDDHASSSAYLSQNEDTDGHSRFGDDSHHGEDDQDPTTTATNTGENTRDPSFIEQDRRSILTDSDVPSDVLSIDHFHERSRTSSLAPQLHPSRLRHELTEHTRSPHPQSRTRRAPSSNLGHRSLSRTRASLRESVSSSVQSDSDRIHHTGIQSAASLLHKPNPGSRQPSAVSFTPSELARKAKAYDTFLGYDNSFLAELLTPRRELCHQKFELTVDDLVFVGHPVCADDREGWVLNSSSGPAYPKEALERSRSGRGRPRGRTQTTNTTTESEAEPPYDKEAEIDQFSRGRAPRSHRQGQTPAASDFPNPAYVSGEQSPFDPSPRSSSFNFNSGNQGQSSPNPFSQHTRPSHSRVRREASRPPDLFNQSQQENESSSGSLSSFHFVLVLDKPDPTPPYLPAGMSTIIPAAQLSTLNLVDPNLSAQLYYDNIAFKMTAALYNEQCTSGYVSREAALLDRKRERAKLKATPFVQFMHRMRARPGSIPKAMADLFDSLRTTTASAQSTSNRRAEGGGGGGGGGHGGALITINNRIETHLQLPPILRDTRRMVFSADMETERDWEEGAYLGAFDGPIYAGGADLDWGVDSAMAAAMVANGAVSRHSLTSGALAGLMGGAGGRLGAGMFLDPQAVQYEEWKRSTGPALVSWKTLLMLRTSKPSPSISAQTGQRMLPATAAGGSLSRRQGKAELSASQQVQRGSTSRQVSLRSTNQDAPQPRRKMHRRGESQGSTVSRFMAAELSSHGGNGAVGGGGDNAPNSTWAAAEMSYNPSGGSAAAHHPQRFRGQQSSTPSGQSGIDSANEDSELSVTGGGSTAVPATISKPTGPTAAFTSGTATRGRDRERSGRGASGGTRARPDQAGLGTVMGTAAAAATAESLSLEDADDLDAKGIEAWVRRFATELEPKLDGIPTLKELALNLNCDLYQNVYPMVRHLIYYREARVIDVPYITNIYTISPLVDVACLSRLSKEWESAFPLLPNLNRVLSQLSYSAISFEKQLDTASRLFRPVLNPSSDLPSLSINSLADASAAAASSPAVDILDPTRNALRQETYLDALFWLLRADLLVQIQVRYRLVCTEGVKRRARERWERDRREWEMKVRAKRKEKEELRRRRMLERKKAKRPEDEERAWDQDGNYGDVNELLQDELGGDADAEIDHNDDHDDEEEGEGGEELSDEDGEEDEEEEGRPWMRDEDDDDADSAPTLIEQPGRPCSQEEALCLEVMMEGLPADLEAVFREALPFFNGKHSLDEIAARRDLPPAKLRALLRRRSDYFVAFFHP